MCCDSETLTTTQDELNRPGVVLTRARVTVMPTNRLMRWGTVTVLTRPPDATRVPALKAALTLATVCSELATT
jgi:hypothetical protein